MNEVDNDDVYLYYEQKIFDMLQDIHQRINLLPIDIKWRWEEGHQFERYGITSWWSRQNARVDILTKKNYPSVLDSKNNILLFNFGIKNGLSY